jgi:hypothetical protein
MSTSSTPSEKPTRSANATLRAASMRSHYMRPDERRLSGGYIPGSGVQVYCVSPSRRSGWLVYEDRTAVAAAPPGRVEVPVASRDIGRGSSAGPVVATAVQPPPPAP